ncbi:GIY-YIG nuclease family protein [Mesorhizobium sp. M7A.F.Ca.MR.148.00.0.0]|uniref:GIY-YIG nuclease family protein n=1 Tax=Mesorhizobium sp. M7A.F.Ca.MR.148.00.0.0 TaxID=2496775 RepID=UPI000FCCBAE3|nr:GIY-YIG nuclease family protein [Mesorhizobium sp. M7A.F.Ca.MR.148.00.0.0]RUV31371.1 excinuclease ABC subunit C [Mesorhizobium sp. M7A.F.Ca.MR.148.00.0.0]
MWYVYFLQLHNGGVYVGSTNDLRRRFESHQSGYVTSIRAYLPVALKTYIAVEIEAKRTATRAIFQDRSGKAFASKRFWRTEPR